MTWIFWNICLIFYLLDESVCDCHYKAKLSYPNTNFAQWLHIYIFNFIDVQQAKCLQTCSITFFKQSKDNYFSLVMPNEPIYKNEKMEQYKAQLRKKRNKLKYHSIKD